jgi:hypothetical protein
MNRRERRSQDPAIQERKEKHTQASVLGDIVGGAGTSVGKGESGGWGIGSPNAKPATGQQPYVNPFIIPKAAGLTITSQTFPSNYYVEWNLSTWRAACDQVINQGYAYSYATLVTWVFQSSPFVQSLFRALGAALGRIPFFIVDKKGNKLEDWTQELCNKPWQKELDKEILFSHFWGFTGLNFDPIEGRVYKYPMQEIDPINQLLKQSTFSFYDGVRFKDYANLLFVQPSTAQESFLGWMQPITRSFIQMNMNKNSWVNAGRRLAFPMLAIGYPQADQGNDPTTGLPINPYKNQAEAIAANIDPSKAFVFPYTIDEKGNIVKSIQVDFEKPGTGAKAHDIFVDFNESEKNEIREMILGGDLTGNAGKNGSRSLGEVQERKLETVVEDLVEWILAYKNAEQLPKLLSYYKNAPDGIRFEINRAKQMPIDDIVKMSSVVTQNGKRLTDAFFEANGLVKDFIEDVPVPAPKGGNIDDTEFAAAIPSRSFLSKKKS